MEHEMIVSCEQFGQTFNQYFFDNAAELHKEGKLNVNEIEWYIHKDKPYYQVKKDAMVVMVSPEGEKNLLPHLSFDDIRFRLNQPEQFDAKKIGAGSEGDVYRYAIAGNKYAVKIFSAEKQERMNESAGGRVFYAEPNYVRRFGATEAIVKQLKDFPKMSYTLKPWTEFLATHWLLVTNLVEGVELRELYLALGLIKDLSVETEESSKKRKGALGFIRKHRITKTRLRALGKEIVMLRKLAILVNYLDLPLSGSEWSLDDFTGGNFLVTGYDRGANKFDLVLIDQGQEPQNQQDGMYLAAMGEFTRMFNQAKEIYDELSAISDCLRYLRKHKIKRPSVKKEW